MGIQVYFFLIIAVHFFLASQCGADSQRGSCPPALPSSACEQACAPGSCSDREMCCPTQCGGAVCSAPVTRRQRVDLVKPGNCPEEPEGPWVCTATCSGDSDCKRKNKCCPNRCGVLTCMRPEAS